MCTESQNNNGQQTEKNQEKWDPIPDHDWNQLVAKIYDRKCVAFLGAGVNVKCGEEDSLPVGSDVALALLERMIRRADEISEATYGVKWKNLRQYREDAARVLTDLLDLLAKNPTVGDAEIQKLLREKILGVLPDEKDSVAHVIFDEALADYEDLTRVALQDLARVSLRYKRNMNLQDFVKELKEIIPDTHRKPSKLLRTLAAMPFRLIITTNYDRLMERALELFTEHDVINAAALTESIMTDTPDAAGELAEFIREAMSQEMEELLDKWKADPTTTISAKQWAAELNSFLQGSRLYLLENQPGDMPARPDEMDLAPLDNKEIRKNRELLERSFPTSLRNHADHKPYELVVQPINGFKGTEENRIRKMLSLNEGLVLYKLHGTFTDDAMPAEDTRPLITEEDYIEFLTHIGAGNNTIDKQITAEIQSSTLLFLGYSLEDWNFRTLFKGLVENIDTAYRPFSYAIQKKPSKFWVSFWSNDRVQIFDVDLCKFTEKLQVRFAAYKRKKENERLRMSLTAPSDPLAERRKARRARSGRA